MSWFLKEEKKTEPVKEQAPVNSSINVVDFSTVAKGFTGQQAPTAGRDYSKSFSELFAMNTKPTLDFMKFSKALDGFNNKPLSEQQKYEFAFTAFQASGVTADDLIKSSDFYMGLLTKEEQDFNQQASQVANEIAEKQKLLESNNAKIQLLQAESQKLGEEIYARQQEIAVEQNSFNFHLNNCKAAITDKINKIKQYINATITQ